MPPFVAIVLMGGLTFLFYPFVHDFMAYLFADPIDWLDWKGALAQSFMFKFISAGLSYLLAFLVTMFFGWVASIPSTKDCP